MRTACLKVKSVNGSQKEIPIEGREVIVGRSHSSDVRLRDRLVSRRHARVSRHATDYYLEDLGSTNGTMLDGRHVRRRLLKHGDSFQIGHYQISFNQEVEEKAKSDIKEQELQEQSAFAASIRESLRHSPDDEEERSSSSGPGPAFVKVLRGPARGETKQINETFHTISDPSGQLATISRRPSGYYLLRLGGGTIPYVNGSPLESGGIKLYDGDNVEFGGYQLSMIIPLAKRSRAN